MKLPEKIKKTTNLKIDVYNKTYRSPTQDSFEHLVNIVNQIIDYLDEIHKVKE
jgi:cell division protein ZapA (FtsZ GTPase activity inhibitor)